MNDLQCSKISFNIISIKPINHEQRQTKTTRRCERFTGRIISSLNDIKDEEQDAYDNMPESLQSSDKGSRMTDAIDTIDEAISSIEEAQQHIDEAAA